MYKQQWEKYNLFILEVDPEACVYPPSSYFVVFMTVLAVAQLNSGVVKIISLGFFNLSFPSIFSMS